MLFSTGMKNTIWMVMIASGVIMEIIKTQLIVTVVIHKTMISTIKADLGNVENCDCTDAENYDFYDEGTFFIAYQSCYDS